MFWQELEETLNTYHGDHLGLGEDQLMALATGSVLFDLSEHAATKANKETCYQCRKEHDYSAIATFMLSRQSTSADPYEGGIYTYGMRTYVYLCTDHARLVDYSWVLKYRAENVSFFTRRYVGDVANDPSENSEAGTWADQWEEFANTLQSLHNIPIGFICTWDQLSAEAKESYKVMAIKEQEEQGK